MEWLATGVAIFLASAVEVVEVVTIVLALGITRGWRSTLVGVGTASVVLALVAAALGVALTRWIDLAVLQVVVGTLLLLFGLQWLRKAILRSSGFKALNDEDELFREETEAARTAPKIKKATLDWFAFTVAFKGMLLEGLEVVFIVITAGTSSGQMNVAIIAAISAAVIIGGIGAGLHRPLSLVPENTLKFGVGSLLTTFGTFWAGEGIGIQWLGSDLAILWLLAAYAAFAFLAVWQLRSYKRAMPSFTPVEGIDPV